MNVDIEGAREAFRSKDLGRIVEYISGCIGFIILLPLVLKIATFIMRVFRGIPVIGQLFRIIGNILGFISVVTIWAALIISLAELAGLIYFMIKGKNVDQNTYIFAMITSGLVLLTCILNRCHTVEVVRIILGLAALIIGIDLFLKVWVDRVGLNGGIDLAGDFVKVKQIFTDIKSQADLDRDLNQAKAQAEKAASNGYQDSQEAQQRYQYTASASQDYQQGNMYTEGFDQTDQTYSQNYSQYSEGQYYEGSPYVMQNEIIPAIQPQTIENNISYFDGTGGQFLGIYLLTILLSTITFSIATPWMIVEVLKWRISHTVIGGKRQLFNGTGGQLIGLWFKWVFLSIITCGIYLFLQVPQTDYNKWVASHTTYVGCPVNAQNTFRDSFYTGTVGDYFGTALVAGLITGLTCGIAYPWAQTMIQQYTVKNTVINTDRYLYTGTGGELFGTYIVNGLLTCITCGIYYPWAICAINRYTVSHTLIASTDNQRIA